MAALHSPGLSLNKSGQVLDKSRLRSEEGLGKSWQVARRSAARSCRSKEFHATSEPNLDKSGQVRGSLNKSRQAVASLARSGNAHAGQAR